MFIFNYVSYEKKMFMFNNVSYEKKRFIFNYVSYEKKRFICNYVSYENKIQKSTRSATQFNSVCSQMILQCHSASVL